MSSKRVMFSLQPTASAAAKNAPSSAAAASSSSSPSSASSAASQQPAAAQPRLTRSTASKIKALSAATSSSSSISLTHPRRLAAVKAQKAVMVNQRAAAKRKADMQKQKQQDEKKRKLAQRLAAQETQRQAAAAAAEATRQAILSGTAPSHWEAEPKKNRMLIKLDPQNSKHSNEYNRVAKAFYSTNYRVCTIRKIERVQVSVCFRSGDAAAECNPLTRDCSSCWCCVFVRAQNLVTHIAYQQKKLAVNKPDVAVFHGTRHNDPKSIVKNGFDTSYGGCLPGYVQRAATATTGGELSSIESNSSSSLSLSLSLSLLSISSLWFATASGYSADAFYHPTGDSRQIIYCLIMAPTRQ
jgi:hypothetical protein